MYSVTMPPGEAVFTDEERTLKRNCKRFRLEAGCTQQQVADEIGVVVATIARAESFAENGTVPDLDVVKRLARFYGHAIDDFYKENPPAPAPTRQRESSIRFKVTGNPSREYMEREFAKFLATHTPEEAAARHEEKKKWIKRPPSRKKS